MSPGGKTIPLWTIDPFYAFHKLLPLGKDEVEVLLALHGSLSSFLIWWLVGIQMQPASSSEYKKYLRTEFAQGQGLITKLVGCLNDDLSSEFYLDSPILK